MFPDVLGMFSGIHKCSIDVFKMISRCFQDVLKSSQDVLRCSQIFSRCSQDVLRMFTGCFNLKDTLVGPSGMVGLVGLVGLVLGGGGGAICLMYQQSLVS